MSIKNNHLENLASGALLSLIFGMVGYGSMFIFKIFSARYFGPEKFGLFEMGNTILGISSVIALLGIHSGVSRYISVYEEIGENDKLKGYISFIFKIPVFTSLLASFLIIVFAPNIRAFFGFDQIFINILRIVALTVPFKVFNEILYQIFYAKNKVLIQNIGNNIIEKTILIIGISLVFIFKLSILHLIIFWFLSFFIAFIFNCFYYKFKVTFKNSNKKIFVYRDWLSFSLPLFFVGFFTFIIGWADNFTIGKIMNSSDLGIYAASFSLASFLLFFQTSFVGIFTPIMSRLYARSDNEMLSTIYAKAQNWVFGMAIPFAMFFFFFSGDIIENVYGREYLVGKNSLMILVIGILYNIFTGLNVSLIKIIKKTKFLFTVKIIMFLFNLLLNILLVLRFGIIGAAISTTITLILEQTIYLIKIKKVFKINHNHLINIKLIFTGLIVALVFSNFIEIHSFLSLIMYLVLYLITYLFIIFLIKAIREEDLLIIKKIIKIF